MVFQTMILYVFCGVSETGMSVYDITANSSYRGVANAEFAGLEGGGGRVSRYGVGDSSS
jgi:hypothetical protein